jgi:hypothetical protein
MVRKSWLVLGLALLLACGAALSAGAQGKGKLGIVFNLWDLLGGTSSTASNDGLSAGLGAKYWLGDKMALRGLVGFEHYRDTAADTTDTYFGVSGAFEYHFVAGRVSPYAGGLVGLRIQGGDTSNLGLLLAGLFGVELRVMESLGLFAEYSLRLFMDEPETNIVLGAGNNAAIGLVVYLP